MLSPDDIPARLQRFIVHARGMTLLFVRTNRSEPLTTLHKLTR